METWVLSVGRQAAGPAAALCCQPCSASLEPPSCACHRSGCQQNPAQSNAGISHPRAAECSSAGTSPCCGAHCAGEATLRVASCDVPGESVKNQSCLPVPLEAQRCVTAGRAACTQHQQGCSPGTPPPSPCACTDVCGGGRGHC